MIRGVDAGYLCGEKGDGQMATHYDDLPKGEGRIVTDRRVAVFKDQDGNLHAFSSVCPHRGCDVMWNGAERVWDCPCHGSRFAPEGGIIRGPATTPLVSVEVTESGQAS